MSSSDFSTTIKDVLRNIVICTGEPYTPSEDVIQLLYDYLRCVTDSLAAKLKNDTPTTTDILLLLREEPRRLNLVINYFQILAGTSDIKLTQDGVYSWTSAESPEIALNRLCELCNSLDIVLPVDPSLSLPQSSLFSNKRKLRLVRIDRRISRMSVEEYLDFSKLRQTASFLSLTKSGSRVPFRRWIFHNCKPVTTQPTNSHPIAGVLTEKADHEGFVLLTHIITCEIVDLIDTVLYQRRKIGIELCSPLTPIELKQAIQRLQSLSNTL